MDVPNVRRSSTAGDEAKATPYATILVTLSKQEHIELVWAANYWKVEHRRAAERALSVEARYEERLRQAARREARLGAELEVAQAKSVIFSSACLAARASAARAGVSSRAKRWCRVPREAIEVQRQPGDLIPFHRDR